MEHQETYLSLHTRKKQNRVTTIKKKERRCDWQRQTAPFDNGLLVCRSYSRSIVYIVLDSCWILPVSTSIPCPTLKKTLTLLKCNLYGFMRMFLFDFQSFLLHSQRAHTRQGRHVDTYTIPQLQPSDHPPPSGHIIHRRYTRLSIHTWIIYYVLCIFERVTRWNIVCMLAQ